MQEGQHFGPYQLIKRIAFGGMAEIHLAKATGIGGFEKLLALKVIHPKFSEDQEFIDMLVDEAKIAVQLSHVNVGQIFDLGHIDGTYYIAMEFIDGKDLYQLLVRCSELDIEIPYDIIAFIAMEVAAGLQYAHTKSDNYGRPLHLIHRDISPQNVLISYDGEIKIVDFGIAKASQRSRETESGIIKGKFFYMSPEQAWGDEIDARTDIFSTGICLYEMITGEMLYNEDKALALLDMVRRAEIPDMRQRRPDLPPQLERITRQALAREREHRYQSSGELQAALSGFVYGTWPGFNRRRVADFMRQVFGDQRFVLPMPGEAPRPAPREAPIPDLSSSGGLMEAEDFAPEHSVIFDLRQQQQQQKPARAPARGADPEDDRTVAGVYAAADELPDYLAEVEEAEDERTITEAVWSGIDGMDGGGPGDDDKTVTISSIPDPRAQPEPPTGMFDAARLARAMPEPHATPEGMEQTRAMMSPGRRAAPTPAAPAGQDELDTSELTHARMSPGRAAPQPAAAPPGAAPRPIQAPPGRPSSPQVMASQPAWPAQMMPGQMPGQMQPMPGQMMPGQPMPGQMMPGQPMPGQMQPMPGQMMPGQPMPGQPMPGQMQPMPGQMQPMPGQPMQPAVPSSAPRPAPRPPSTIQARASAPSLSPESPPTISTAGRPRRAGPGVAGKLVKKVASPVGIALVVVVLLLVYGAVAVLPTLPTLFEDPPPPTTTLLVESVPPGADVTLDGQPTGQKTPATLADLNVGHSYTIDLALAGYRPKTETVTVSADRVDPQGAPIEQRFFLDKAPGELIVESEPPGAEIYVRGRFLGKTPWQSAEVDRTEEKMTLTLRMPKYRDKRVTVDWSRESRQTVKVDLEPTGSR
ncbi:MAG: protein kinase [bacterium]